MSVDDYGSAARRLLMRSGFSLSTLECQRPAAARTSMPSIVVGGHSRKVGKTSVTAGLIHAFREYAWTAIKISSHRHANIPMSGPDRNDDPFRMYEETDRSGTSDTSRFLAAGASRAFWLRANGAFTDDNLRPISMMLQSGSFVM